MKVFVSVICRLRLLLQLVGEGLLKEGGDLCRGVLQLKIDASLMESS